MNDSRLTAKSEIERLVRYFEQNIHQLKSPAFSEAQARQSLIDPFFDALGWDVRNKQLKPPYMQEVIPEGRVKTSLGKTIKEQTALFAPSTSVKQELQEHASMLEYIADDEYKAEQKLATKKPDYRFRIQGSTKFFVEAKKPSVDLRTNLDAIFQIKRYGFSARVPVSILTDFEEFRLFDCTRKPFYDKPKAGALKEFDLTCKAYLDEFDKLYDTFSREAVGGGSLDALQKKYLEKRTGEFALDRSFLDDLSEWRVELAQDIAKHPKNRRILNSFTLNECVQRILDRIVFLRVCEDRNIEETGTLLALQRLWQDHPALSLYEKFNELIRNRRSLYNGLLFAEHECEQLDVGNKILEKIFKNVNYPLSPYHFDEIGVEILGSIYERFLGKTIRLTNKQVRIEEKPEVRKAGGVYYTPQYIVNYIVDNTLGKLLYETLSPSHPPLSRIGRGDGGEGQPAANMPPDDQRRLLLTPRQVSKLRIIDIACGSGSFLLGAFQKLIDYHIKWYTQHPKEIKEMHGVRDAYTDNNGQLRLSSRKKREILVNNIYGVDIDRQAVEVTQMSLYLKVLEDENDATLNKPTMLALHEVLLPPLKNNIKCGNSLIGTDFLAQGDLFDDDARRKVNPFDWEIEFSQIINPSTSVGGGFDCVIGNPPYGAEFDGAMKQYLGVKYRLQNYQLESYLLFMERAVTLLKRGALFGYIIPNPWLTNVLQQKIRRFISCEMTVRDIVHYKKKVFPEATVDTEVVVLDNNPSTNNKIVVTIIDESGNHQVNLIDQETWKRGDGKSFNIFLSDKQQALIERLSEDCKELREYCKVTQGAKPYQTGKGKPPQTKKTVQDHPFDSVKKKDKTFKPLLRGSNISRYQTIWNKDYWISFGDWLAEPRYSANYEAGEKIVIRQTGDSLVATLDDQQFIVRDNLYTIVPNADAIKLYYVLGLLNSTLFDFVYQTFNPERGEALAQVKATVLKQLPICRIDFSKPMEKEMHDDLVGLVEKMLDLHKQLQKASFETEKEPIERQIAATDKKIDDLVYKLYGLTEEEVRIIEGT